MNVVELRKLNILNASSFFSYFSEMLLESSDHDEFIKSTEVESSSHGVLVESKLILAKFTFEKICLGLHSRGKH